MNSCTSLSFAIESKYRFGIEISEGKVGVIEEMNEPMSPECRPAELPMKVELEIEGRSLV